MIRLWRCHYGNTWEHAHADMQFKDIPCARCLQIDPDLMLYSAHKHLTAFPLPLGIEGGLEARIILRACGELVRLGKRE